MEERKLVHKLAIERFVEITNSIEFVDSTERTQDHLKELKFSNRLEELLTERKDYYDITDFLEKFKALGYLDTENYEVKSLTSQVKFLEDCCIDFSRSQDNPKSNLEYFSDWINRTDDNLRKVNNLLGEIHEDDLEEFKDNQKVFSKFISLRNIFQIQYEEQKASDDLSNSTFLKGLFFPYAINWMWNYCIYLGPYVDSNGEKWDLGYHEGAMGLSAAAVFGNTPGEYKSGELNVFDGEIYQEIRRRLKGVKNING